MQQPPSTRRSTPDARPASDRPVLEVSGTAKVGRRTKDLIKTLGPGDIAVIDHRDLDRVAGEGLAAAGVAAVVNASPSISGRYPNGGPMRVVEAGIPLIDDVGRDVMDTLRTGAALRIVDGALLVDGVEVAEGTVLDVSDVAERMETARDSIGNELERFAVNTLEYIEKEARLLFEPIVVPEIRTRFAGRHVLIVVRGHDYKEDLRALRPYIVEYHPVLVGVDGGADALLDMKLKPDMIIGDFDSLSERAWHCGAELVHHVHPDGRAPGREELLEAGLPYEEFVIEGTSEDAAMLLAYECRAELIVAVGTHATMVEFLDKGRAGMSSTFLTRLRLGPMLIDAKGVSQLYRGRVRRRDIAMLVAAAILVILAVAIVSDSLQLLLRTVWLDLRDIWYSLTGRFT
ncbi:MAG: putative cytokinetic ring protein SteA [Actinomycetota bacterium]|nr:putative cytokinetic ring protein SteA [Actinomycetota bacterium]